MTPSPDRLDYEQPTVARLRADLALTLRAAAKLLAEAMQLPEDEREDDLHDLRGVVATAVVHDDQLDLGTQAAKDRQHVRHDGPQVARFVEGGNHAGNGRGLNGAGHHGRIMPKENPAQHN